MLDLDVSADSSSQTGHATSQEDGDADVATSAEKFVKISLCEDSLTESRSAANVAVSWVTASPEGNKLICVDSNSHTYIHEHVDRIPFTLSDDVRLLADRNMMTFEHPIRFDRILWTFHVGPAASMDVCSEHGLAVTCGVDGSLKVWNFKERSLILDEHLSLEISSVSFHPDGNHVAVCLPEDVRVLSLCVDVTHAVAVFPVRGSHLCSFSRGGQLLAVAMRHKVTVFDVWSPLTNPQMVAHFSDHRQRVLSLWWNSDELQCCTDGYRRCRSTSDEVLISTSLDGTVFVRSVPGLWYADSPYASNAVRLQEFTMRGSPQTAAVRLFDGRLFVCGNDRSIKELDARRCNLLNAYHIVSNTPGLPIATSSEKRGSHGKTTRANRATKAQSASSLSNAQASHMSIAKPRHFPSSAHRFLVVASPSGVLRVMPLLLRPALASDAFSQCIAAHCGELVGLHVLPPAPISVEDIQNDRPTDHAELVVTCGADGVLCVFEAQEDPVLEQARQFSIQNIHANKKVDAFSQEQVALSCSLRGEPVQLILHEQKTNFATTIDNLENQADELTHSSDFIPRMLKRKHDEEVNRISTDYTARVGELRQRSDSIKREIERLRFTQNEQLSNREAEIKDIHAETRTNARDKALSQAERFKQLFDELRSNDRRVEEEQARKRDDAIRKVEACRARLKSTFESARAQHEEAQTRLEHSRAKARKQQKIELEDIDHVNQSIIRSMAQKYERAREATISFKGSIANMNLSVKESSDELREINERKKDRSAKLEKTREKYRSLVTESERLQKSMRDQMTVMDEKNKRIEALRERRNQLVQSKDVRASRYEQLRDFGIEPKERELAKLREEHEELSSALMRGQETKLSSVSEKKTTETGLINKDKAIFGLREKQFQLVERTLDFRHGLRAVTLPNQRSDHHSFVNQLKRLIKASTSRRKVSRVSRSSFDERQRKDIAAKKSLSVDIEVDNLTSRAGELRRELHSGRRLRERRVKEKFRSGLDLMDRVRTLREKRRVLQQKLINHDKQMRAAELASRSRPRTSRSAVDHERQRLRMLRRILKEQREDIVALQAMLSRGSAASLHSPLESRSQTARHKRPGTARMSARRDAVILPRVRETNPELQVQVSSFRNATKSSSSRQALTNRPLTARPHLPSATEHHDAAKRTSRGSYTSRSSKSSDIVEASRPLTAAPVRCKSSARTSRRIPRGASRFSTRNSTSTFTALSQIEPEEALSYAPLRDGRLLPTTACVPLVNVALFDNGGGSEGIQDPSPVNTESPNVESRLNQFHGDFSVTATHTLQQHPKLERVPSAHIPILGDLRSNHGSMICDGE